MGLPAMKLNYDGPITIATASSRKSVSWKNQETTWGQLAQRLSITQRTAETQDEYSTMRKSQKDDIKDVGGFVGGSLRNGRRKAESIITRQLLTLDIDSVPYGEDPWPTVELVIGCAAILYSTHSHTARAPRLRLVMPLSRKVTPDEYAALSRRIAGDIGIDMCDDTTYEAHRLMYWPSTSIDADYRFEISDSQWLDVDEQLARYKDWRDSSEWPVSSRKTEIMRRLAKKQGDPLEKPGVVGAFCRVYSIEDAIEQFLPEVYEPSATENRYDYIPADSSAGLVVYDDGKFAYSHHATDPICGKLCNAFDLVRLHLFGDQDDAASPGTPVNRLPSYTAMSELAIGDEAVRKSLAEYKLKEISAAFDEEEDTEWLKQLSMTPKGKVEATIDNAFIIITHDPELRGKYYYDEFRERPVVCGDLPWINLDNRQSDIWTDSDDAGVRRLVEKKYDIDNLSKIRDAVDLAMLKLKRHPVREYLNGLVWDGVKRADTLFIDYLDAEDTEYTREVTRRALIGAVARIMSPGCKHDHILVLVGPQGCRKSTTLAKLGKGWFSDSLYTLTGKDAYEQLQGYWIIEMGEMAATRKAELEQMKQFISKQSDNFRAAYARRTQEHPRQCAFFGSTNDEEFLRDSTGNRRFWPVAVTAEGKKRADRLTEDIVDQIWAESVVRYKSGEQWYLSDIAEAKAKEVQSEHTEQNGKQGVVENFLESLVPKNWDERELDGRLMFYNGGFSGEEKGTERRDRVCALEIWAELFKGDIKAYTQAQAREITGMLRQVKGWKFYGSTYCGKPYGKQRAFVREGGFCATPTKSQFPEN
ncbi:MAG: virulence-associated E family protein [Oscillospiraceae bacterium]|nr:virulence-associated E family protein [Oscillospiraceae bacterium]